MALVVLAVVLALFVARLVQVQGVEAASYAGGETTDQVSAVRVPAERGEITDADGVVLARSVDTYTVVADPLVLQQAHGVAGAAARLSSILGVPQADLTLKLSKRASRYAVLAKGVTPQVWAEVQALGRLRTADGSSYLYPGFTAQKTTARVYPNGSLAGPSIGWVTTGQDAGGATTLTGAAGIEKAFDRVLRGTDGQTVTGDAAGAATAVQSKAAVAGSSVRLTLDSDLQNAAAQALQQKVTETGAVGGTVTVLDVQTQAVLALASAPSLDPGHLVRGVPLSNSAISDVYEPGSTGKAVTASALIDTGAVTPETPILVPPVLERAGTTFHDSETHAEERLTFAGVIAKSSNMGTILASEKSDAATLDRYFRAFGLGSRTGIELPAESAGLLPSLPKWTGSTRYTIPFGQGYSVTSLQMASVYATIANGGVRSTPHVVAGTTDPSGVFHAAAAPAQQRVLQAPTAAQVTQMLEGVTGEGGTAAHVSIPGYVIAGKTGTAQRVDPVTGRYSGYTASFIGYAPADHPRFVVAVVLQDPQKGHYGSTLAGPVFAQVASFALKSYGVPPTGTPAARLKLSY